MRETHNQRHTRREALTLLLQTLAGLAIGSRLEAAPAGTPSPIVKRLNEAFQKVQADPEVRKRLAAAGLTPVGGSPDDFGKYIRSEIAKWSKVIDETGVKAEE